MHIRSPSVSVVIDDVKISKFDQFRLDFFLEKILILNNERFFSAYMAGELQSRQRWQHCESPAAAAAGGGCVTFSLHCLEHYSPIVWTDDGRTDGLADDRLMVYYIIVCEVATIVGDSMI